MKRFTVAVALIVGVLAPVSPPVADAHTQCAHNSSAQGGHPPSSAWWNNWWVGYNTAGTQSCDLNGNFTVGIQRINWHLGYRQSGIDGLYGPGTHQDVRSYQAFYGLSLDGLVGHATWASYGDRAVKCGINGSLDLYRINNCSTGPITFAGDVAASPQIWYVVGLSGTWKQFWMFGPN